tara:strand:+ start:39 stop:317 length:279 start_codon:yes stop_codon:yes gene_type:complete
MLLRFFTRKRWKPTQLGRWSLQNNWERSLELAGLDSCVYGLGVYSKSNEELQELEAICQSKQRKKVSQRERAKQRSVVAGKSPVGAGRVTIP